MTTHRTEIIDLINCKRASGFDPAFEALLREAWYCPNCRASKTILVVMIPLLRPEIADYACSDCGKDGIRHIRGRETEHMSKLMDSIAPFDRSGNG